MGLAQILRQEGHQEGRQEGRQNESVTLVTRMLRRKLGIYPELEQLMLDFKTMSVEKLEELAEALLDFSTIADLIAWLNSHNDK